MFRKMIILMGVIGGMLAMARVCCAVQVDGYAYLGGQTNHEGIKVLFEANTPTAITDSVYTNSTGYYEIDASTGFYDIYFSYENYFTEEILDQNCFGSITLPDISLCYPLNGALCGVLEKKWYIVLDDIYVQYGDSLTIDSGALFFFDGYYSFEIDGYLCASGTADDSIKFMPNDGVNSWDGIKFNESAWYYSRLDYCLIMGSSSIGIALIGASPTITHCTIRENSSSNMGGGIYCYWCSYPTIAYCVISGNSADSKGGGIMCLDYSDPIISHCVINENSAEWGGGIYIKDNSDPDIENCTISGNISDIWHGGGIYLWDSHSDIINTIIEGNTGGGIYFSESLNAEVMHCDLFNNGYNFIGDPPQFLGQVVTVNINGDSCDAFFNIFEDPLFIDPSNGDFHLQEGSHCIDAGDPNFPLDPDSTIADIGVFYYDQSIPAVGNDQKLTVPREFYLLQNFPNPFNAYTTIYFALPRPARIRMQVYDIFGQLVATLVDGWRGAGTHEVVFDGSELASGIYLVHLKAEDFSQVQKMVLMK